MLYGLKTALVFIKNIFSNFHCPFSAGTSSKKTTLYSFIRSDGTHMRSSIHSTNRSFPFFIKTLVCPLTYSRSCCSYCCYLPPHCLSLPPSTSFRCLAPLSAAHQQQPRISFITKGNNNLPGQQLQFFLPIIFISFYYSLYILANCIQLVSLNSTKVP